MSLEVWKPQFSSQEYWQRMLAKGNEIADHIVSKHNGLPATACHKCIILTATFKDLQELYYEALKAESEVKPK